MKNYILTLKDKQNNVIDFKFINNCMDRKEAKERIKALFMFQGLRLSNFKVSLKQLKN